MIERAQYVVVEGPIGAGKTTLARRLAARLSAELLLEQPEMNPFLSRFYQNMDRWALPTQLSFLFQRTEQLKQIAFHQRSVSDFLPDKDTLFAQLTLSDDEHRIYQKTVQTLRPIHPVPELVIYLQAKPETLLERIRRRGHELERRIDEDYLTKLSTQYSDFFHHYNRAPLFIVNTEVLNPIDNEEDFELLFKRLVAMRGYREFFSYS